MAAKFPVTPETPLRGKPFLKGKGLGKKMRLAWTAKGSPFGRAGALAPERARPLTMCSSYYVPLSAVW